MILFNYCSRGLEKSILFSNFWLLYTFLLGSGSIMSSIVLRFLEVKGFLIFPILYLIGFVFITTSIRKELVLWWRDIMISESNIAIVSNFKENCPLPLPKSQAIHIATSFSEKMHKAMIFTPRALVRLSNQAPPTQKARGNHKTTRSMVIGFPSVGKHIRSRSAFPNFKRFEEDPKEEDKENNQH